VSALELKRWTFDGCDGLPMSGVLVTLAIGTFDVLDINWHFSRPSGRQVDMGWNIGAGAGINFSPYVGAMLDFGYNSMGVTSSVLNNLGFGGGSLDVFSATLDPIVHLNPKGHVDAYLTGGGGFYHQYQNFTQPTVAYGTGFNPFFGYYPFAVPANVIVSSYTVNKPGIDAGAGFALGNKWHGEFFAEAKHNRIFVGSYHTDYVPVTFGFVCCGVTGWGRSIPAGSKFADCRCHPEAVAAG
jgi:hypothetical protein